MKIGPSVFGCEDEIHVLFTPGNEQYNMYTINHLIEAPSNY